MQSSNKKNKKVSIDVKYDRISPKKNAYQYYDI